MPNAYATFSQRFTVLTTLAVLLACSSAEAPRSSLSLASTYHLRSIGGLPLPISESGGGFIDSGHVRRIGRDTIWMDRYSHTPPSNGFPGTVVVAHGTWLAAQSGNIIVLQPLLASTVDTLFLGGRDTLTRHTSAGAELYVAP